MLGFLRGCLGPFLGRGGTGVGDHQVGYLVPFAIGLGASPAVGFDLLFQLHIAGCVLGEEQVLGLEG